MAARDVTGMLRAHRALARNSPSHLSPLAHPADLPGGWGGDGEPPSPHTEETRTPPPDVTGGDLICPRHRARSSPAAQLGSMNTS